MSEQPTTVVFRLECPDPRAWVVLTREGSRPRVLEMWQPCAGVWSACAVLLPGDYRCRCYAGDGRTVSYCGPAVVDGGVERGMDTLITVSGSPVPYQPGRPHLATAGGADAPPAMNMPMAARTF
jgi:hypothetical protein